MRTQLRQSLEDRSDHLLVELLDEPELGFLVVTQPHIGRHLGVHVHEVLLAELAQGRFGQTEEIRSAGLGHSGGVNRLQSRADPDSPGKIRRGQDCARDLVLISQAGQSERPARSPQPETVRRLPTRIPPLLVHGMIAENDQRGLHHLSQDLGAIAGREELTDRLSHHVLRVEAGGPRFAAHPDHQMAGSFARIKLDGLRTELFVDRIDQLTRLVVLDSPRGGVFHRHLRPEFLHVFARGGATTGSAHPERDHSAPEGDIVLPQRDSQTGGFKRSRAGMVFLRVVPQNRQWRHLAARRVTLGHHRRQPNLPVAGKKVHVWSGRGLRRFLSTQVPIGHIRHALPLQNHVLHPRVLRIITSAGEPHRRGGP